MMTTTTNLFLGKPDPSVNPSLCQARFFNEPVPSVNRILQQTRFLGEPDCSAREDPQTFAVTFSWAPPTGIVANIFSHKVRKQLIVAIQMYCM